MMCQDRLQSFLGSSPATPFPTDWKLSAAAATALPASNAARTLTVASNRSASGAHVEQLLLRARLQLSARAYVHHYAKYGVDTDFLQERFEAVQTVVDDYADLGRCLGRPAHAAT
eukprot:1402180-Pleurochrysis_carterae.AAC.1